VYHAH